MSIIIATTAAEAAAVVRELDGQSVTVTTTLDVPWAGLATNTAAETAAAVPEVDDLDDIDLMDTAASLAEKDGEKKPRNRSWDEREEKVVKVKIRAGMNCRQVGDLLGRSESSVQNKLASMEHERAVLGLDPIRPKKVTA